MVDWTNPCERAAALREAYFARLNGRAVTLIKESAGGGEREVRYATMDISILRAEMQTAEDECRKSQGLPPQPRRFAITAGSRRR
ncbi:hypothetical protein OCAR_5579 [Afipia carboxidovorans OM5]|uniref:Uncharacterized protein n=1 Tax=Afipia carboxidovorans (strain ATCC 49405 / DSM 1227 / KCTC 32145 / OM5) TaxID=504832 RepID=B6JEE5_AFIC5|nr:hypothetical protein [Afipia carboxidovorans]ACI92710.1 hypothetical protein OCAR_5579 [Afipia carboxidovorans OM5]AEI03538.1 hypothetical protein OCA4_c24180 [Afipia carboxidovorans OM4]AEI07115.1 hypothetical protein OCA5_c24190 [Afipia carboxidovorans OM5]BEV44692.1 hypothetical protein CRBSH125_08750 [Afipia carboxidovorans]